MEKASLATSQIKIYIGGNQLTKDISSQILETVVDQHVHLPDMFMIRLIDTNKLDLLDGDTFDLTKIVKIEANNAEGEYTKLIEGEITAIEPTFLEGMNAELIIRGYDNSHRLFREVKSKAHVNVKDSDLATTMAGYAKLKTKEIEPTTIVYEHLYQDNQSDLAYLTHRAWRIGYECYVENNELIFRKPKYSGEGVEIKWGDDLLSFYPRMTLAEQVDEVVVKGWDVAKQAPIIGKAEGSDTELYPQIKKKDKGPSLAQPFGNGKLVVVDRPVISQSEADEVAKARFNELSGAFVDAEGIAFRRPDIRAGKVINITSLGEKFSGSYLVTSCTHSYTEKGLHSNFSVRGMRSGTLVDHIAPAQTQHQWLGVVVGKVTNVDDPNKWARVKVKYPWMADDVESDWIRVMGNGAGPNAGFLAIPEVDDEVLVAFEHGDINFPFVIGGVWNGEFAPPEEMETAGKQPLVRVIRSRTGHVFGMFEADDHKVEIITAGGHEITMQDTETHLTIKSSGGHLVELDDSSGKITIKSTGNVEIEASGNLDMKAGGNMKLEASGMMDVKSTGPMTVKGTPTNVG